MVVPNKKVLGKVFRKDQKILSESLEVSLSFLQVILAVNDFKNYCCSTWEVHLIDVKISETLYLMIFLLHMRVLVCVVSDFFSNGAVVITV